MMTGLKKKHLVVLVALAAVLPFLNSLSGDFVWDDRTLILQDYKLQHLNYFSSLFLRDYFEHADEEIKYGYYRPLVSLSLMADFSLWGPRPFGFHLTNVLLHGAVSALVFLFLSRLFPRRGGVALASALVFAVHPVHCESVAWISGRTDLIATGLMLSSLLALASAPARRWGLPLSLLLFLLAPFAKESALVLPPVAAAYLAAFEPQWARRRAGRLVLLYGLAAAVYLTLRFAVAEVKTGAVAVLTPAETVFSSLSTLLLYLGKILLPLNLTAYITNPPASSLLDPRAAAGAAILAAILFWLVRSWRKGDRPLVFILAFALVSLAPLANIVRISGPADMGFPAAERFLYAPSIALIAAGVALVSYLLRGRRPRAVLTVGAVLVLAVLTVRRNAVWRDEGALFADALRSSPNAPLLWNNLGVHYSRTGRHEEAVRHIERGLSLAGPNPRLLVNLAAAMRDAGRFEESLALLDRAAAGRVPAAIRHNRGRVLAALGDDRAAATELEEALKLHPARVEIMIDLAETYKRLGFYDRAERVYEQALELHPAAALWSNLGVVRKLAGDLEGARAALMKSLSLDPGASAARGNLGVVLARMGLYPEALRELRAARSLDPANLDAANALGVLLAQTGEESRAEGLFLEIARDHPGNGEAYINMGILQHRRGRKEEAARWFERARAVAPGDPRVAAFFRESGR
ncbi:MAG: tetratricopeptide repeat protein [bacterium]|nr:tetratricopeptide repeat protein [bacterium]